MNYNFSNIPYELRSRMQWVLWAFQERDGKLSKVPFQTDGNMALANAPSTWSSFAAVEYVSREKGFEGIGFMFSKEDDYVGIDIDNCIDEKGNLSEFATYVIEKLDSYTEFSPSGKGIHIIAKGKLPDYVKGTGKKSVAHGLEIYQNGRYFTMTGNTENENAIYDREDELEELFEEFFSREELERHTDLIINDTLQNTEDDAVTWERMFSSKVGSEIRDMYDGKLIVNDDHSSTDISLANHLAFWCDKDYFKMDSMFRQTGLMRDKWDEQRGDHTYGEMTLINAISSTSTVVGDHVPVQKEQGFKVTINENEVKQYNFTELGNAEWFSDVHSGKVLFSSQFDWLLWNGKKWESDDINKIERMAAKVFKELWEAEDENAVKWAKACESRRILTNSLALSKSFLPVRSEELDRHKYLFNVQNGILDLKSGLLLPHGSKYLLTKISTIGFEKNAECPTWEKFVASIFKDAAGNTDYELIRYVQKLIGYSMTADISEQSIFFLYGNGKNGKSTFINVIHDIMGEYARQANKETFISKDNKSGANNDVARLVGSRFVSAIESDENEKLDESFVKQATGGEKITARFLNKEFFEFTPEFKVFFTTNHKPIIKGTDEGIWRRVKLIPFTVQIAEADRDNELPVKLRQEMSGILNWMLEGCLAWQKEGLKAPKVVEAAGEHYKTEMDVLHPFLSEHCNINPLASVELKVLYENYKNYVYQSGEIELKKRPFTRMLETKGFEKKVGTGNKTYIHGLRLNDEQQRYSSNLRKEYKS